MSLTVRKTISQSSATHAGTTPASAKAVPVVIATRRRCEADGMGLSHYVLMDPKGAK